MKQPITLLAVGDVVLRHDDPKAPFSRVLSALRQGDIVFAHCDTPYSERGTSMLKSVGTVAIAGGRSHPKNVAGLQHGGINVMSFANSHCLDWGYEAFFDTIAVLKAHGISPVGVGKDLAESRTPAVLEKKGTRVAFLSYAPVTFPHFEAAEDRPGCAPMRIHTVYHHMDAHQPGSHPGILTYADRGYLESLQEDVRKARSGADVVVVTFHWGLHFLPVVLAMYESELARAAIDAGADLILGHHQHILKGIEVYRGKVIFHCLGNFLVPPMRPRTGKPSAAEEFMRREVGEWASGWHDGVFGYHPDGRQTIIAKAVIAEGGIQSVSFLPCMLDPATNQPEVCPSSDSRFAKVTAYIERVTREAGLDTRFQVQGDEVFVQA